MPRIPRGQVASHAYHVLNRGNGRAVVFHKDGDYAAFIELVLTARTKFPVKLFGFCLMPNHFHLVVQPDTGEALSRFMQWSLTSHVRRYHEHYQTTGHVWQGRFKSFPIQQDEHLLTVLRYVLRNPVRAGLVQRVSDWPWSSVHQAPAIDPWPQPPPLGVERWLDEPVGEHDLHRLRDCVVRQRPFGSSAWQTQVASAGGLESTLRPRGRPRKRSEK